MFRDTDAGEMTLRKFGVGSTISAGNKRWLVVGFTSYPTAVAIMDMQTMTIAVGHHTEDGDRKHLTKDEDRAMCDAANPNFTFTDFSFDPAGLKQVTK